MKKVWLVAMLFLTGNEVISWAALAILMALVFWEFVKQGMREREEKRCSDMN